MWYPLVLGRERGANVLHCPTYRGPLRSALPLVVTVHDLAVLRHPEAFNRWSRVYGPRVVPHVLQAASRVIAVSEFTRRELVDLLHVPDEKIRVVPNAVNENFTLDGPAAEGEYVLAVGRSSRALRRAALGIIRIIRENGLWIGLLPMIDMAGQAFQHRACIRFPRRKYWTSLPRGCA